MSENNTPKVIYTALFLTTESRTKLLQKIPPVFEKIFAHHLTLAFKPTNGFGGLSIGQLRKLIIIGYLIDKEIGVQACLVKEKAGNNKHPHITISTMLNVKPSMSNVAIEKAVINKRIVLLESPLEVEAIEGYFDGQSAIVSNL